MKGFVTLLASVIILSTALPMQSRANEADMQIIEKRMFDNLKKGVPSESEVEQILALMTPDGGFNGIDYLDEEFNSGDKKRLHFTHLSKLAKSLVDSQSKYFNSATLYKSIERSISFWLTKDIDDANWWHRSIGFPKDLAPIVVLMSDNLRSNNPKLWGELMIYLDYSRNETPPRLQLGANGTDISKITFIRAVLSRDDELLASVISQVESLIFIADGGIQEGIYPDYSFSQHCANGRQLYLGTYGREYLDGVLFFAEYADQTQYGLSAEKLSLIEGLVTQGVAWIWYKNELDPNQLGRKMYDPTNFAPSFVAITKRLIALNTPKRTELERVLDMMEGRRELVGNRAYPYHDYMIHRGEGYMTTIRMTSTRTVGNEAGNGQGFEHYHTGDGATYFKVFGDEYSPIFGSWNWRFIPGTTIVADTRKMPIPMWGKGGKGGDDFAAVASNGKQGVAGFVFRKDSLVAHKAWFNLNEVTVALGAAITTERKDADVVTTINQTSLHGAADLLDNKTLWHRNIGYEILDEQSINVTEDKESRTLRLSIEHGVAPRGASYAYAVYPNIDKESFAKHKRYFNVIRNDCEVQAVRDLSSGSVMAIFYKSGVLQIDNKQRVEVSHPSALICTPNKTGYDVVVADPFCETKSIGNISIKIFDNRRELPLTIVE